MNENDKNIYKCNVSAENLKTLNSVTLAYIGDSIYNWYIKKRLLEQGIKTIGELHKNASYLASAKCQSLIYDELQSLLEPDEIDVLRRGRNAKSTVPKSATVEEYKKATAVEALLGYIYIKGDFDRLGYLLENAIKIS
ncbi:MAG: Mini-ribonuclease 3 [Clostridiales bacterium]|jgi:ribonuclease-3 family protein|nr:Mini-ribonuclease 3 [Clostridiales bacterium]